MNELKELLDRIYANQVILFKKLDKIEGKLNNSTKSAGIESYKRDLDREADNLLTKT